MEPPTCLLYLLTVGREKELVLRVHDTDLSRQQLSEWMETGAVHPLTVSRSGDDQTSTLLINFSHVVGARLALYSDGRSTSF
ncbi:hypothetical protein Dvina_28465 [Dactylosporangium vinaceum]|uniref:Uncharacterized protein n=1 Tax=Dactylosporangium vinaceum TaxID=53362 RepID=A0ABV5M7R7_9ACTN|nr:hypothetical protein [Dactylosporangium vinaceum]UAB92304.1 hypothetical protein Dvina_28465 [Dactylosporangium vinaceum]